MKNRPSGSTGLRDRFKSETRKIILDSFAELLAAGDISQITFADIAAHAGIGERTVYRHFPTRDDLLRALYGTLSAGAGEALPKMESEDDLTENLGAHFLEFDANPAVIRSAVITPQGHELRMASRAARNAGFVRALESACAELNKDERILVAGVIQHVHSASAWLALREGWGLTAEQAAIACTWAIRAMLKDLKRRKGKSIASG